MNLFILSDDPNECARMMFDTHIVKIITEAMQMLCTANRILLPDYDHSNLYKLAHVNHPVTKWIRESQQNYIWTIKLLIAMHDEYQFRYGQHKFHKAFLKIIYLNKIPKELFPKQELTPFVQAMPESCKHENPIIGYRTLYQSEYKRRLAKWTKRGQPEWFY